MESNFKIIPSLLVCSSPVLTLANDDALTLTVVLFQFEDIRHQE